MNSYVMVFEGLFRTKKKCEHSLSMSQPVLSEAVAVLNCHLHAYEKQELPYFLRV